MRNEYKQKQNISNVLYTNIWIFFHMLLSYLITEILILECLYWGRQFQYRWVKNLTGVGGRLLGTQEKIININLLRYLITNNHILMFLALIPELIITFFTEHIWQ